MIFDKKKYGLYPGSLDKRKKKLEKEKMELLEVSGKCFKNYYNE